jgi:3-deoxy-D-manno-octulosonic-acid transferase
VKAMLAADAAVVVQDGDELTTFVRRCLEAPDYAARLGQNARTLVQLQQGAAERTVNLLATLMEPTVALRRVA